MITIHSRSSRTDMPTLHSRRRRAAITLLGTVACLIALAGHAIDRTATPGGATITSSSARGGVSQMSAMKAEG